MQGMTELLKSYVTDTVMNLVDNPDEVKTDITLSTKSVIVQIRSKKSDLGKIIGKKGRTIEALKLLTHAIKNTKFPRDARRVSLEIIEEESNNYLDMQS